MSFRKLFMTGALALTVSALAPAKASADWLFTPFVGGTFGGSANITDIGGRRRGRVQAQADLRCVAGVSRRRRSLASRSTSAIRRTSSGAMTDDTLDLSAMATSRR